MLETAAGDYPPPVETETHLVSAELQRSGGEMSQGSRPWCTQLHQLSPAAAPESHGSVGQGACLEEQENTEGAFLPLYFPTVAEPFGFVFCVVFTAPILPPSS